MRDGVAQRDMVSRVHDEVDADTLEALHQEVVLSEHTDFTIFHEKMEQLRDVIPDEATLFAAAAKTSGSSKAKLVSAVGRHLQLLAQEREEFARETDRRVSEKVASLRAKQEGTQSEIASMDAQIAQLQERQRALRETLYEQSRAIDEENSRIENGRKVFSLAADTLQKTLEESREKGKVMLQQKK